MSKMNKEFEYKGYKFNTSVELNSRVERRIDGKKFHKIITNDMGGGNFYITSEVEDEEFKEAISHHENQAKIYVDKREKKNLSPLEELLTEWGFS